MNTEQNVTPGQLRALQSLWSAYSKHSLDVGDGDPRAARLAWASKCIGRELASFNELRAVEAATLIDALKVLVGQQPKTWRRPRDRESARAAGRHGRRGFVSEVPILVSREDLDRVDSLRQSIGMSADAFNSWLNSKNSPVRGGVIRTLADANRVVWAFKAMARHLRRAG
jgi:hypothetical protein